MRKLIENFHIFYFQKRIVSAEIIRGTLAHEVEYLPLRREKVTILFSHSKRLAGSPYLQLN